jgi:asparagine synthase (glutamine-hydrolysing)
MCGVAGLLTPPGSAPVPLETLSAMVAMLGHRGPDGYGLYRDDRIGLAHGRLSIIDVAHGFQPVTNEDRSVWLSFNGEIFNFVELRRELKRQGHRFATEGDSEVIVHLYEQHGEGAWKLLNGQFAFALWDRRIDSLWLVRDRLGILPMHLAATPTGVVFGSEIKALLASRALAPVIDPAAVVETFTRWSAAAPRTMFAGVQSVQPGTSVRIDHDLHLHETRYWQPNFDEDPAGSRRTVDDAADELGSLLEQSVRLRLRADVPVGAYLSGGLDSSVIASLVRDVDSSPLETFAVRFADARFDEGVGQRRMADLLGTEHHEIGCGDAEIRDTLGAVVWHCESPLLRTAPAPLFLLSGLVHDEGMKVVLTGEGADELFAGYGIFKEDKVRRFWAADPSSAMRPRLLARAHSEVSAGAARESDLWQRFFGRNLEAVDDPTYSHMIRWSNTSWTQRVLAPTVRAAATPAAFTDATGLAFPAGWAEWAPLARAQWLEITTFMSPYLLAYQGDRVAMAHGVEVRYPFLDPDVVDFAMRLPTHLKMPALRDKLVLRRLAGRTLPPVVAQMPKAPYRAPMTAPLFSPAGAAPMIDEFLSGDMCERYGLVDATVVARLVDKARRLEGRMAGEREEMALIGALTLQMLARDFIDEFGDRARAQRALLERAELHVFEDRVSEPSRADSR